MQTALDRLKDRPQWVAWKYKQRGNGKPTKPPVDPNTGRLASIANPAQWASYNKAKEFAEREGLPGVGYVLTPDDNLTGADLDNVRDAATGEIVAWAAEIVALAETYCEISPSGTGLRFFWIGTLDHAVKNDKKSVELYCDGRYLTVTHNRIETCPDVIREAPQTLAALIARAQEGEEPRESDRHMEAEEDEWSKLNTAALNNLDSWVPDLFDGKARKSSRGGYRVSSSQLGRDLEEDLSITPLGIVDFGIADQGDSKKGKRTPIKLVMEQKQTPFDEAVGWLCEKLGLSPPVCGVTMDDFIAYMPMHSYVFTPTGEMWPAASVNVRLKPVEVGTDENGKPKTISASAWLDRNRAVEQMTWAPGMEKLIQNRLVSDGGWIERKGATIFNLYRPPTIKHGDRGQAEPWCAHIRKVFGDEDGEHIIKWLAQRVQRPQEKINHALVLGGKPGIGKDSLLEPVKQAVGAWNFTEVTPQQMLGRFNGFAKSVILRINEARDLGDVSRYQFYDHMKNYSAAPPDVLRVDEKHLREHSVFNCTGVIITSNYKSDGIYLPADDRRHFVAWSDMQMAYFTADYWNTLWRWYQAEGTAHVTAYLAELDLSGFDPKAPPPKTPAFWAIVDANRAPEDGELADLIEKLGEPEALTLTDLRTQAGPSDFGDWLGDRKNRRKIPHRLEQCGYVPVRNDESIDGLWKVKKGGRPYM